MYRDRSGGKWKIVVVILAVIACVFLIWLLIDRSPAGGRNDEAAEAIRTAVRNSALQCYVVEGAYPPDLKYLEDNYGLRVNTADYYIIYDAFAENQLPDVRVTKRVH